MLGYLQKIGRALMVPVALLPAAAILMGVGYWISASGEGVSGLAALLTQAGGAILENMPILFAVGVAYGLSKDKDGAAALAGLVGYLVVTTLLSPDAMAQMRGIAVKQVPVAFGKIKNPFIGLLCGVIAAELYNRFSGVELHKALAFFSGRRLVPIVTSVAMVIVSLVLMIVWPVTYGGLVTFGESIVGLGAVGAGIYGFLNRLLIPVGLHHALNSVFWFDVAGINDIPNFLGGAQSIAKGTATPGVTGMYQAGFFPIMMFGLPGAALAICQTAKASNRAKVISIMGAAALASLFTGVTEPLEFSFMFAAPLLYVLHAVLTGISLYIAATMHWMAGFGFSAGLVDLTLSSRNPLAVQWYMLIVQGLFFFCLYYALFRALIVRLDLRTPGREDDEAPAATKPLVTDIPASPPNESENTALARRYVDALGGFNNLTSIDACITRLRLTLANPALADEARLKALGAAGVIRLGEGNLQVVLGPKAEIIAGEMKTLRG